MEWLNSDEIDKQKYFAVIYPTKDAFDGTSAPEFDVCFDNWIGKDDWNRILDEIENHLDEHDQDVDREETP